MLDYSQVHEIAQEAAGKAESLGQKPLNIRGFDPQNPLEFIRRIPFLGDYTPTGWEKAQYEDLFVDSSGFGSDNEAALSVNQFTARLAEFAKCGQSYGFGISQAGEFQVYIRIYNTLPISVKNYYK